MMISRQGSYDKAHYGDGGKFGKGSPDARLSALTSSFESLDWNKCRDVVQTNDKLKDRLHLLLIIIMYKVQQYCKRGSNFILSILLFPYALGLYVVNESGTLKNACHTASHLLLSIPRQALYNSCVTSRKMAREIRSHYTALGKKAIISVVEFPWMCVERLCAFVAVYLFAFLEKLGWSKAPPEIDAPSSGDKKEEPKPKPVQASVKMPSKQELQRLGPPRKSNSGGPRYVTFSSCQIPTETRGKVTAVKSAKPDYIS